MATTSTARLPAKLSPPRLQQTLRRERLFAWIDAHAGAGLWICGPPGAGKTQLAASYPQARATPLLWYRFDADDNDPGKVFGTLDRAVRALGARRSRPRFAAEHLSRLDGFARRWFAQAFAELPRPLVLVFDNLEQATMPQLPSLLAAAVSEAVEGLSVLMTSREAPPAELAALQLSGALAVLPGSELAFTPEEAAAYARLTGLDAAAVARTSRRMHGWAAGLRLADLGTAAAASSNEQLLFHYFDRLMNRQLDQADRLLLLHSALLPWVPSELAAALTGVGDAPARLEALCRINLFTERVDSAAGLYRLHPLWREFLLLQGRRAWTDEERRRRLLDSAMAFEAGGDADAAIDLLLDAHAFDDASQRLQQRLESALSTSHLEQWSGWVRRLPPSALEQAPMLRYGLGRVCFLREDPAALLHYEQAARSFEAAGDRLGCQLCAAGILEWSYNTDSFIGHGRWTDLLGGAFDAAASAASLPQALRLLNGGLLAAFFSGDFGGRAAEWVDRVLRILERGDAETERLSAAITLLGCLERAKRWDEAGVVAGRMEALLHSPNIGPRIGILVRQQIAADLHRQTGAYAEARRLATQSRAEAHDQGFGVLEFEGLAVLLFAALYEGDDNEARRLLLDLDALVEPGNVYHLRFGSQMHAWFALQVGHPAAAREHEAVLRQAVARSDMPAPFRATWLLVATLVQFATGDETQACADLAALASAAEPGSRATLEINRLSLLAWRQWRDGNPAAALPLLEQAFGLAGPMRYYQLLGPLRGELAELAALALERRVAPAYASELIQRRKLRPPSSRSEHWPWALRISTLGHFDLRVDGELLTFDGKVPRRPLALLKALIASGAQSVPQHRLIDALWPDEDAAAANDAFHVALHRLRRLIPGGSELIRLQDGRLSLDLSRCWLDCLALDAMAAEPAPADADAWLSRLQRALALYQGHFLADDAEQPWSVSARERLRSRFNRLVVGCSRALLSAGRVEEALEGFRRGIELDDLDEELYRGVMQCALVLRQPAVGLAAFRKIKRLLSIHLGIEPAAATETLMRRLAES